ncbi:hypothetical protein [Sphingobium sp. YBL2]|uniref:hypothetical protein n=1 Tax=Sphingobium sp. (strain YBL2) TaxID=484429 RepID=UPI0012EE98CE|nr:MULTISPECIES: hypothetical protein [Sphingomonadaceae]
MKPKKPSEGEVTAALVLIETAIKLLDKANQGKAAIHCQEALEVLQFGDVARPIIEPVRTS